MRDHLWGDPLSSNCSVEAINTIFWIGLKFFPVSSTWKTRSRYLFSDLIVRSWIYTALPVPYYIVCKSVCTYTKCTYTSYIWIYDTQCKFCWRLARQGFCGARWSLICNGGQLSVAPRTHSASVFFRSMALEKTSNRSRKYWLGADIDNFSAKSAMYHYLLYP